VALPQFTADAAAYQSTIHYNGVLKHGRPNAGIVPAQTCPPPGLCEKASRCCRPHTWGTCCDILSRCLDCEQPF
jgi:hypothetical protein